MAAKYAPIQNRGEAERRRLRKIGGLDRPTHFHRPVERAFPVIDTYQPPRRHYYTSSCRICSAEKLWTKIQEIVYRYVGSSKAS